MKAALLALLLIATAGCKKKSRSSDLARAYRNAICACRDLACANKVGEDMQKAFVQERPGSVSDAELMQQATECWEKLSAGTGSAVVAEPTPAITVPGLPAMPKRREVDALLATARAWQKHPKVALSSIHISYVDSDGVLDEEFGTMRIAFGASRTPVDDPKRKTGAPIKADETAPDQCPTLYAEARGWGKSDSFCPDVPSYIPKCTVVEIWKRAVKDGAPKDALAVIEFQTGEQPSWSFNINDEPRKVNVSKNFADDCERTLEKPQSDSPK